MLLLAACKEDDCGDVNCVAGTCVAGECICNQGYEGEACDFQSSSRFPGVYETSELCNPSGSDFYSCTILQHPDSAWQIQVANLFRRPDTITGTVSGTGVTFALQPFGNDLISGSGAVSIDSGIVSLDYVIDFGSGVTESCLAILRP